MTSHSQDMMLAFERMHGLTPGQEVVPCALDRIPKSCRREYKCRTLSNVVRFHEKFPQNVARLLRNVVGLLWNVVRYIWKDEIVRLINNVFQPWRALQCLNQRMGVKTISYNQQQMFIYSL